MAPNRTLYAFTLIELMISIALGILILYTAFAGFRTASQAITIANSLSLENSLLRAGYFQVQNDLDFWTSLDDPNNSSNQQLRGVKASWTTYSNVKTMGNPFTPMSSVNGVVLTQPRTAFRNPPSNQAKGTLPVGDIQPRPPSSYPASSGVTAWTPDPWESDNGFDPTISYSPSDPRTWCRVNLAEKNLAYNPPSWDLNTMDANFGLQNGWGSTPLPYGPYVPPVVFGRYGIFSNTSTNPTFGSWQIGWNLTFVGAAYTLPMSGSTPPPPPPPQDIPYMVTYTPVSPVVHTWSPNQVQLFLSMLGYQALCEYLPPNAIYNYYMSQPSGMTGLKYDGQPLYGYHPYTGSHEPSYEWDWSTPCSAGGMARQCTQPGWGGPNGTPGSGGGFRNWDGNQITSCGIYRETYSTSFGYFNPWAPADPNGEPQIFLRHYMHFDTDYTAYSGGPSTSGGQYGLQDLLAHTAYEQSMLPLKPTNWPTVSTAVGRLIKNDHFVAVAKIRRINPLTGTITELSFLGLGTTLRGARMQRLPTSGWATWDDDPTTMTSNSVNMDTSP